MIQKIPVPSIFLIFGAFLILVTPFSVDARHNQTSYSRAISELDDDIVETFFVPVLFGVAVKNISENFGDSRDGGARVHEGQDIMALLGTPIVTPTEAVVTSVGFGDSAGNYVYTANPGGERFRYMHLDEIADIKAGDVLDVGDFIGTVGDTGNAKGAGAHLHFEIRDKEPLDPFPRITENLTLKEKMVFVENMFKDLDDEDEMAEFLVDNFQVEFKEALNKGYDLPSEIKTELKKAGIVDTSELLQQLEKLIASIPTIVTKNLSIGDSGVEVSLLQVFLIYEKSGPSATALSQSGATGYFGPLTQAAIREYQTSASLVATGIYNNETRKEMVK